MLRTEIDRNEPLNPGDVIEMHFKAYGPNLVYLRASELALLEWRLRLKNPDYELLEWQSPGDELILTFLIKPVELGPQIQRAGIETAIVLAAIVIGGGLFAWLCLDKVYRITESPAGQVALAGTGSLGIGVMLIAAFLLLSRYWK